MSKRFSLFLVFGLLLALVSGAMPAAAQGTTATFADPTFQKVWERTDAPVASGAAGRTWFWGPTPGVTTSEPYAEGDGGVRKVQYFDKARMEINDPSADPNGQFYVTNGLLTVELIRGRIQVGNSTFQASVPANIPVAGDTNDANAPTYASFGPALAVPKQNLMGKKLDQVINRSGQISTDMKYDSVAGTEIAYSDVTTGRNIPTVFWNFVNSTGPISVNGQITTGKLSDPWYFATGLPISEAYWATVNIAGTPTDVLIQAFERRVLTFVPSFAPDQQVQMGNIGRHYYEWRYNGVGRTGPVPTTPGQTPVAGTPAPGAPTAPPATPTQVACNVPPSVSSSVEPACGPAGTLFVFTINGFEPNEPLSFWFTTPDGEVVGTDFPSPGAHGASLQLPFDSEGLTPGIWALTFQGDKSKHQSISYFQILEDQQGSAPGVTPTPSGPVDTSVPPSKDGSVTPPAGKGGTNFDVQIFGMKPNENMSYWLTDPTQAVYGSEQHFQADGEGKAHLTFRSPTDLPVGIWATTFHGLDSGHESVVYFRILP